MQQLHSLWLLSRCRGLSKTAIQHMEWEEKRGSITNHNRNSAHSTSPTLWIRWPSSWLTYLWYLKKGNKFLNKTKKRPSDFWSEEMRNDGRPPDPGLVEKAYSTRRKIRGRKTKTKEWRQKSDSCDSLGVPYTFFVCLFRRQPTT